jgi:uncharacterized membrane protein HdeD (DUF308 family)
MKNEIINMLRKKENTEEIKSIFYAIVDICFLDIYPYFYFFCTLFILIFLFNLAIIVYLVRGKFSISRKK